MRIIFFNSNTSFICTTGYGPLVRNDKARLITLEEVTNSSIGNCTANAGSCKKLMSNYLNRQVDYNNTYYDSSVGNGGYWVSTMFESNGAYRVFLIQVRG